MNAALLLVPEGMHDSGVLDHEVLVVLNAVRQLTAVAGAKGQHLSVNAEVAVLQTLHVINVVL